MNTHMVTPEYREGYQAYQDGVSRWDGSYDRGSTKRACWLEGWLDARDDGNWNQAALPGELA